ncbi:MAG: hypothetical protein KJ709_09680 [Nanoarchaeota archaeon]|nr:hypothetical protein [Nanoarchaeota archaeon]
MTNLSELEKELELDRNQYRVKGEGTKEDLFHEKAVYDFVEVIKGMQEFTCAQGESIVESDPMDLVPVEEEVDILRIVGYVPKRLFGKKHFALELRSYDGVVAHQTPEQLIIDVQTVNERINQLYIRLEPSACRI